MPKKKRTLMVVGKLKEFDEDAWKRLLLAYTYYLHEQRNETDESSRTEEEREGGSRS